MKRTILIPVIAVAVIASLAVGIYFTRIDERFLGSTFTDGQSQAIKTPDVIQLSAEEKTRIRNRIEAIKLEVKKEQNDPDRAIELRTELFTLEKQMEGQD